MREVSIKKLDQLARKTRRVFQWPAYFVKNKIFSSFITEQGENIILWTLKGSKEMGTQYHLIHKVIKIVHSNEIRLFNNNVCSKIF